MARKTGLLASLLALVLLQGGCMGLSIGGGSTIKEAITPPTIGREIEDLAAARRNGTISDDEFERAKQKLLTDGRRF